MTDRKYYAVRRGRRPGIYENWSDCRQQISSYSNAAFKSFKTLEAAREYLQAGEREELPIKEGLPLAYIDGSYSRTNSLYSWGGFIYDRGTVHILQGTGNAADYLKYRNISGEVRGALAVIQKSIELKIPELNLFYDYAGIGAWAGGSWKCENELSQFYRRYYLQHCDRVKINFFHVAGHTGVKGNEIADYLAKEAAGVKLRKKDIEALKQFREQAGTKQEGAAWIFLQ